jgi:DHA2 family multidrug resistance protein
MGSMFLLPVFMQELMGYDATESGVTLMPRTLAMLVVTPFVGRLYNKISPAYIIAFGALTFCVGSLQLSHITLESSNMDIVVPLMVTGVGLACLMIPLTTVALSAIERKDLADAAGLNSFMRQIGGSIGLTIFATLLGHYATHAKASVGWHISSLRPEVASMVSGLTQQMTAKVGDPNLAYALTIKALNGKVAQQGMVLAFEKSFFLQALVFIAVLPLLAFLRVNRENAPVHIDATME